MKTTPVSDKIVDLLLSGQREFYTLEDFQLAVYGMTGDAERHAIIGAIIGLRRRRPSLEIETVFVYRTRVNDGVKSVSRRRGGKHGDSRKD